MTFFFGNPIVALLPAVLGVALCLNVVIDRYRALSNGHDPDMPVSTPPRAKLANGVLVLVGALVMGLMFAGVTTGRTPADPAAKDPHTMTMRVHSVTIP